MSESIGIDSLFGGRTMPRSYSADIRGRVIARVEGGASAREAAEQFEISPSAAIKWVKCFRDTGRCAAMLRGGSDGPMTEKTFLTYIGSCLAPALRRGDARCLTAAQARNYFRHAGYA